MPVIFRCDYCEIDEDGQLVEGGLSKIPVWTKPYGWLVKNNIIVCSIDCRDRIKNDLA